jgi:hypothetical protein
MQRILLCIVLVVCSCDLLNPDGPADEPFSLNDNDRQIYALLINTEQIKSSVSRILVVPESNFMEFNEQSDNKEIDEKVTKRLAAHYNLINADTVRWDGYPLDVGIPIRYIERHEIDSIFSIDTSGTLGSEQWHGFYAKYPDVRGYYTFSKIAYNGDSTVALASFSHLYGSLGGDWQLVAFTRESGAWKFYKYVMSIVS